MALKVQSSFAAGELDPALHERTTLQKYSAGLATGRNVIIGKTGRVISRMGRKLIKKTKTDGRRVLIYCPADPDFNYFFEWGHLYVRAHHYNDLAGPFEAAHSLTEDDMDNIHFESANGVLYVYCRNKVMLILVYADITVMGFLGCSTWVAKANAPTHTSTVVGGTGYDVEYAITAYTGGRESSVLKTSTSTPKLPITTAEKNTITVQLPVGTTEIRVYRRPKNAGAFGYIGSSSYTYVSGATLYAVFDDVGQAADYTHSPPELVSSSLNLDGNIYAGTGCIYQRRMILSRFVDGSSLNSEAIVASRVGLYNDYYRDYPYGTDSALLFNSGASGSPKVLRMVENDGLVVFTTVGVFLHTGVLTATNLALVQKGNWVIDERIPPLAIPGGVLFVDKATNTVRVLSWSTEAAAYSGDEVSVFSDHLFHGRTIKSWAFHAGELPLLFVVFSDGEFASFTYEREHEMRAWTRHDISISDVNIEYVARTPHPEQTIFVVEKDDVRYMEITVPRYVAAEDLVENPEAHMGEEIAAMDSMKSFSTLLNDLLTGSDQITVTPLTADVWDDSLTINGGTSSIFAAVVPGDVLRHFNPEDGSSVDLEVFAKNNDNEIVVWPNCDFPEDYATDPRLYLTKTTFTGLTHLNGEYPAVVVDGYVVCSPNNDIENYPTAQVVAGSLTLPGDIRGAIVHIGRPYAMDIETLDVDSVEQRPVLIESKTCNKIAVKVHRSRGLYAGNKFPANDKVNGMQDLESFSIDYEDENEIIGNRYQEPETKRVEVTIPGDWRSNGRVCLRQVDPIHFEILSIIPDIDDLRR